MKKMTNTQKILKALESGSSTQAGLAKQTKVKNTYQVISDLVKKGLVSKVNGAVILNKSKLPTAIDETKVVPNEHVDRIAMLKDEIDNINDGIRALMMTKSYLLRRAEEESRRA
jgi:hypothetical protein